MDEAMSALLDPARATTDREFEDMWDRCVRETPAKKILTVRENRRTKVPRAGTITERSTAVNQRKLTALMETPPPPPPRHRTPALEPRATRVEDELERLFGDLPDLDNEEIAATTEVPATRPAVFGPSGPPPVKVRIDGHDTFVPYFAATLSRRYRVDAGGQRYLLRFNRAGQCVYARKVISDRNASPKVGE